MGKFYERINSPRHTNINSQTKKIVTKKMAKFKEGLAFRKLNKTTLTDFSTTNPAYLPKTNNTEFNEYFSNVTPVKKTLACLPNKCSSGLDKIPPIVLKHLPNNILIDLTIICNNCLNLSYFPKSWKIAKVLTIHKKDKDPHSPSSYRPISLTPSLSKVLEIIIDKHIALWCYKKKQSPTLSSVFKEKLPLHMQLTNFLMI